MSFTKDWSFASKRALLQGGMKINMAPLFCT